MIERAYREGERLGLSVWCTDQAGPYQTKPYTGQSWAPSGLPERFPHEYHREGTAKVLTLFHPASGQVRVKGVSTCPNAVLHPWLQQELTEILARLPAQQVHQDWEAWYKGLSLSPTRPKQLPPLRLLLILDNLTGHKSVEFVLWCFAHGIALLYTPLSGSWLNMAESIQAILKQRALAGQHPQTTTEIMQWFEDVAAHWNQDPTPFVWKGKRHQRRKRLTNPEYPLKGSAACTRRLVHPWVLKKRKWQVS